MHIWEGCGFSLTLLLFSVRTAALFLDTNNLYLNSLNLNVAIRIPMTLLHHLYRVFC